MHSATVIGFFFLNTKHKQITFNCDIWCQPLMHMLSVKTIHKVQNQQNTCRNSYSDNIIVQVDRISVNNLLKPTYDVRPPVQNFDAVWSVTCDSWFLPLCKPALTFSPPENRSWRLKIKVRHYLPSVFAACFWMKMFWLKLLSNLTDISAHTHTQTHCFNVVFTCVKVHEDWWFLCQ